MKKKVKAHVKSAIHSAMLAPTHRKNVLRFYSFIYFRARTSAWGGSERENLQQIPPGTEPNASSISRPLRSDLTQTKSRIL